MTTRNEHRDPVVSVRAPKRRMPHRYGCRHCAMVELYRLARDTAIREKEVACGDEDAFVPTLKWWLTNYQWEPAPSKWIDAG
jgi:hypothetical protein